MRLAVVTHPLHPIRSPYEGGLEMHTAMTVEHLVRQGHEVTVYGREGTDLPGAEVVPILPPEGAGPDEAGFALRERALADACERRGGHSDGYGIRSRPGAVSRKRLR